MGVLGAQSLQEIDVRSYGLRLAPFGSTASDTPVPAFEALSAAAAGTASFLHDALNTRIALLFPISDGIFSSPVNTNPKKFISNVTLEYDMRNQISKEFPYSPNVSDPFRGILSRSSNTIFIIERRKNYVGGKSDKYRNCESFLWV